MNERIKDDTLGAIEMIAKNNIKNAGMKSIYDLVEFADRKINKSPDAAVEANRQALLDRSNVGIVKYGTTLMDNKGDLRYWLNHALEECLDQANYLRRAIMEIDANHICETCKGTGQICMGRSGRDDDGNAPLTEACPECGYGN